ncbi:phospholipase [Desulfitobacterium sp.]|uniref:phospholipase n=1 Tax=Desulfitobacterium sp. TaxID=49981 RepID=UPI002B8256DC|nr:phospholipase [Desulfitobacterium sp.]HVJ49584.1 phospholipase [Desulfitobacterium sp.]
MSKENFPALVKMTKFFLAPMAPLQYFLDTPGVSHDYFLRQAYEVLTLDGKEDVRTFFQPYHAQIRKGLFWADRGWKNVCHFYANPEKSGSTHWPGATAEAQYYFNHALSYFPQDVLKGMFYFGASLHIIQDMTEPHHAVGSVFDGHQEFEKWVTQHWEDYSVNQGGIYPHFTHPSQYVESNAQQSASYYSLVSTHAHCNEETYKDAAQDIIPLTIKTTAGYLDFMKNQLQGVILRLQ